MPLPPRGKPPALAFGVDPTRAPRYSLRQARYDAAAEDIDRWAAAFLALGQRMEVLDVGFGTASLLRHLEPRPHFHAIDLDGADYLARDFYGEHLFRDIKRSDLMAGMPEVPSERYDVVVCEQVLEHLADLDRAIPALERVLKPGGRLIVGVPIFLPPLAWARAAYVSWTLRRNPARHWSHIQTFSQRSFLGRMQALSGLSLLSLRGFRIASEGILNPLENQRWWWRLNRRVGEAIPWACIEIQAFYQTPPGAGGGASTSPGGRAA
ncbi:class I SAM-dependent methyltransferase [Acidisoma sp. C75]